MSWWEQHVVPRMVDISCNTTQLERYRRDACAGLSGRVLEVGFGSGLNVAHYPEKVEQVAAVEPSDIAWRLAQPRIARSSTTVIRTGADGQRLTEPAGSVDSVLSTFTMCTIPDLETALAELHRVLRPGGRVHFLEHGLAPDPGVRRWQRRFEPLQRRIAGGCHLTRQPVEAMRAVGFEVDDERTGYLPGPFLTKPFGFVYRGTAVKA